jgi:PD-(D/E)XK nuclease superfamily protein
LPNPVISATRLKTISACERKYVGHYLFGLREAQGGAAAFGEQFHKAAEVYQLTGVVPAPESPVGKLLRSGTHFLRRPGSGALIEAEHRGEFPDGTEWVAYVDASDAPGGGAFDQLRLDDQKTTSDAGRALTDSTLANDLQAGLYSWIAHTPHLYRLDEESDWQEWVPSARTVALMWNYFLTRGSPKAWQVRAFVDRQQAARFLDTRVMPLVERINALHAAFDAGTLAELNHADHDLHGCGGVGTWCGAAAECNFNAGGLVSLRRNKESQEPMGLAELRAKYGQKKTDATPAPAAAEPVETVAEEAPVAVQVAGAPEIEHVAVPTSAARTRKARVAPPAAPPAPEGDTINPPEAKEALAAIRAEVANDNATPAEAAAAPVAAEFPQLTVQQASTLSTDVLVGALVLRGYTVTITQSKYEAA